MVGFLYYLTKLLCYYINLGSLITCCLSSGDIYLSFDITLSCPIFSALFVNVPELLYGEVPETFVILSAILLPIK